METNPSTVAAEFEGKVWRGSPACIGPQLTEIHLAAINHPSLVTLVSQASRIPRGGHLDEKQLLGKGVARPIVSLCGMGFAHYVEDHP